MRPIRIDTQAVSTRKASVPLAIIRDARDTITRTGLAPIPGAGVDGGSATFRVMCMGAYTMVHDAMRLDYRLQPHGIVLLGGDKPLHRLQHCI